MPSKIADCFPSWFWLRRRLMGRDDHGRGERHERGCDPDTDALSLLESKRLAYILRDMREELTAIRLEIHSMALRLDGIEAGVTNIEDVGEAIMVAFNALAEEIRTTPANQAAIDSLSARVKAKATVMKDAILANTDVDNDPDTNPTHPASGPGMSNPDAPQFSSGNPVNVSGDFRTGARGTQQFDQRNAPNDDQLAQFRSQNPDATPAQIESFRTSRTGSTQFGRDGSRNQPFDSSSPTRTPPTDAELARFKTENPNATPEQINQFRMLPR